MLKGIESKLSNKMKKTKTLISVWRHRSGSVPLLVLEVIVDDNLNQQARAWQGRNFEICGKHLTRIIHEYRKKYRYHGDIVKGSSNEAGGNSYVEFMRTDDFASEYRLRAESCPYLR